ncbi:hypothetical protein AAS21_gp185 [Pantoea phage vB_PagS_AAS21]|uniref:Uncharacterized protein n=1 Tax=Pantoea phage vB_PagS_AAS21 TaxID=2575261 RepID=A0A4Y5P220_9CAUD|nr:hypothetical protein AAS21_gp185 [Pantoea phage vB_PagS_AAS21]
MGIIWGNCGRSGVGGRNWNILVVEEG